MNGSGSCQAQLREAEGMNRSSRAGECDTMCATEHKVLCGCGIRRQTRSGSQEIHTRRKGRIQSVGARMGGSDKVKDAGADAGNMARVREEVEEREAGDVRERLAGMGVGTWR